MLVSPTQRAVSFSATVLIHILVVGMMIYIAPPQEPMSLWQEQPMIKATLMDMVSNTESPKATKPKSVKKRSVTTAPKRQPSVVKKNKVAATVVSQKINKKPFVDEPLAQEEKRLQASQQLEEDMLLRAIVDESLSIEKQQEKDLVNSYQAYILGKVRQYWRRPPSARNGMKVLLVINMIPNGYVSGIAIKESSGDESFDRSAIQAIKKAAPFDRMKKMSSHLFEKKFRQFNVLFNPKDLRQ